MRRCFALALLLLVAGLVLAQNTVKESEHYRLSTGLTGEVVGSTLARLEGAYALFSDIFHMTPPDKLRVTLFPEKKAFDSYLTTVIKETRPDFVYIHYSDTTKSELVAYYMADEKQFDVSLLHQACIQFLKSRIPHPPVWLLEGTAAYFERSTFNRESGHFQFKPNLAWLPPLKQKLAAAPMSADRLITLSVDQARAQIDSFYPMAWALVAFLVESPDVDINRIYWDSLSALDPGLNVADNSRRVMERAFAWYGVERLQRAYMEFARELKGFNELVAEGTDLYGRKEYDKADDAFVRAMRVEPDNFVPYYYSGLIKYGVADYKSAEMLFLTALDLGADPALVNYALGVNAFAGESYERSRTWLLEARKADPRLYSEKVDSLLARISTLR
jgi:tetratricopeptide (TPR) repeat protein